MNWRVKALVLTALDSLPFGSSAYHRLQKLMGTNQLFFDESLRRAAELVSLIEEAGGSISGATVVEIGSGWRPFIPFVLRLAGAERVLTLDVNPWMDRHYVVETYCALASRLTDVAGELDLPLSEIRAHFPLIDTSASHWAAILEAFKVTYRYPGDARSTGLKSSSVDVILSSNVLEHVSDDDLAAIHEESLRILVPGGLAVHRFNPEDHFATVDKNITRANFLRFSARQWTRIAGRLAYHNRLRCRQHQDLLEHAGFETLVSRVRIDQRSVESIRSGELPIHEEFDQFTPEELAADYMWLVGRRPITVTHEHQTSALQPSADIHL